ncbi:hypothetical protein TNCV_446451 [Trichonephila clavipes]|nr:hypothetical protein TNCV_446451 [Trichonephila clavipes]
MVLKANDRRTSCPCHDEFRGPRSDYVRQVASENNNNELRQYNVLPHVAKTVLDFCSAQSMQLLPWPAYSPDMSPNEHVWDLVGRRLARDPRPAASKDELLLHIQVI